MTPMQGQNRKSLQKDPCVKEGGSNTEKPSLFARGT
jgi:hypothetical protein